MDRDLGINAAREAMYAKADEAKARADAKRKINRPEGHLHVEWSKKMKEVYGDNLVVPRWGGREKGIARALVNNIGDIDQAVKLVAHFIETWEARQTNAQRMKGELPSIHLCWAHRQKLLAELSGIAKVPMTKREKLARREFGDEGEELSPEVGWGS